VSLDLTKVAAQIWGMVAGLKAGDKERRERLGYALDILRDKSIDLDHLRQRIDDSQRKTTWLVAGLVDGLDQCYKPLPLPEEFSVIATDGSHIDVDRHKSARCYLINIGAAVLDYGTSPSARLESLPQLYFGDEELVIASDKGRGQLVEGPLLGIKRAVEEVKSLTALAKELPPKSPTLALIDGSLILWNLEAYPDFVTEALLDKGFIPCLEEIRKLKIALASYISFPRATDVVNALRVAICPYEAPDCDRYCPNKIENCDKVAGVQDRELFIELLAEGERSALFISQSSIVQKRYGENKVYFFYLRLDDEIARVEIPRWVAEDEGLLNLTHSLILDQCRRGLGYPVALSEAHEKAVVTTADREEFWRVVESLMVEEKMPTPTSAKSFSKRTRWV
jgi:hypothetical protein